MKSILTIALFLFNVIALLAQESSAENVTSNTLNNQFEKIKSEAETFKQYKLIEKTQLNAFWKTTMDSVKQLKQEKASLLDESESKDQRIETLESTLSEKNDQIDDLETQTSTIEVFGAEFQKSTFIFISFFTAGSLIVVLGFVSFKYQDNNRVAQAKVNDYNKLNDEFEEYKRNALEKQMKLRRDLQTERNKIEEARK